MEVAPAVERRKERETALQRLSRKFAEFGAALARLAALAAILTPLLLASFLTVDIPIRFLDPLFGGAVGLRPSNWLSRGDFLMSFAPLLAILFTRRVGGDEATRAVTASWLLAAAAVLIELSVLAPVLEDGDFPSARFSVVFVLSAMAGQYVAVNVYDIARGGGRWWRAPLFAAIGAYLAYALIYFPGLYAGTPAPWINWMVADYALKTLLAAAFLALYWLLRARLRPKRGLGGR